MAPIDARINHDAVEQQLKDIIQDLYQVMVQVSTYDSMGRASKDVLSNEIKTLSRSLQTLHTTASPPNILPSVPPELLEYVENGRNPDIYTREFVELVRRGNQLMRGKMHAFGSFRDVLAQNMATAMPELRDEVAQALDATGGSRSVLSSSSMNGSAATGTGTGTAPTTTSNATPATTSTTTADASGAASAPAAAGGENATATSG